MIYLYMFGKSSTAPVVASISSRVFMRFFICAKTYKSFGFSANGILCHYSRESVCVRVHRHRPFLTGRLAAAYFGLSMRPSTNLAGHRQATMSDDVRQQLKMTHSAGFDLCRPRFAGATPFSRPPEHCDVPQPAPRLSR